MSEILAVGNSIASSADFTVAAGASVIVHLKNATGTNIGAAASPVYLELKVGAVYMTMEVLNSRKPGTIINGGEAVTTWRARRVEATADSVGAERT